MQKSVVLIRKVVYLSAEIEGNTVKRGKGQRRSVYAIAVEYPTELALKHDVMVSSAVIFNRRKYYKLVGRGKFFYLDSVVGVNFGGGINNIGRITSDETFFKVGDVVFGKG